MTQTTTANHNGKATGRKESKNGKLKLQDAWAVSFERSKDPAPSLSFHKTGPKISEGETESQISGDSADILENGDNDAESWEGDYLTAVNEFLSEAKWLTAVERPLAVQLRALARSLDKQMRDDGAVQSALSNAFSMTWARLLKRTDDKGKREPADPLADMLQPMPGMEDPGGFQ